MQWYEIQNLAGRPTEVSIYDEIGVAGIGAQELIAELAQIRGPILLRLNSGGGEVFEGLAIYHALANHGDVTVRIEGVAASIASVIAMAAAPGKLEIAKHASMMVHDGFAAQIGNAAEMRKMADVLEAQSQNIAEVYAGRSGVPANTWRQRMQSETWYIGQAAVDAGLADRVVDVAAPRNSDAGRIAARSVVLVNHDGTHAEMTGTHTHGVFGTHSHQANATHASPEAGARQLQEAINVLTANGYTAVKNIDTSGDQDLGQGWVRRDGEPVFDPDGDGDDDATAEGDTDHDYFDPDGTQIKEIPDCPGMPGTGKPLSALLTSALFNETAVDRSAWDASRAWHGGATADDPAAFYRGICAGRKSGDPDNQSSWALPYKYTPSSPPNAAGVRAALGRLSSTQGLTNESEARSLLEGLMRKINPDYQPSDLDTTVLQSFFVSALESR